MSYFVSKKKFIIIATLLIVGVGLLVFFLTNSRQPVYASAQHGFQVNIPTDFTQEVSSNPENIAFTRSEYLPFSELIPNIQILVSEMKDSSSGSPKILDTLEDYITTNDLRGFGVSPTREDRVIHGIPTNTFCRNEGLRTCVTYALLPDKNVLKIILNYPTQGEFSGKQDPAMEAAFKKISMSLKFTK